MHNYRLILFFFLFATQVNASSGLSSYYWSTSTYEAEAATQLSVNLISNSAPSKRRIQNEIMQQMRMILYPLHKKTSVSVKGDYQVEITSVTLVDPQQKLYTAEYILRARYQLPNKHNGIFKMDVVLQPDTVLQKIIRDGKNLCGGGKYRSDYWLYWNPRSSGCPLVENTDYMQVTVEAKRLNNTVQTYPEYDRLRDASGNMFVALFFGDDSPQSVSDLKRRLSGFSSRQWTEEEIFSIIPRDTQTLPKITELTKQIGSARMTIRVFTGITGGSKEKAFHYFFKDAVERAAFVGYSGHAGLGQNLNYARIEKNQNVTIRPSSSYQIYLINACHPYHYYTGQLLERKQTATDPFGTKNLDIVMSEGDSFAGLGLTVRFLEAMQGWMETGERKSYQELLKGVRPTHAVTGDHD